MSRVGKKPITIPSGVTVTIGDSALEVKGPKGTLSTPVPSGVEFKLDEGNLVAERKDDSFKAWVMVKAPSSAAADIVSALKAGSYYSSTGPRILDITRNGSLLTVRCTPVRRVFLAGLGARSRTVVGAALAEVELDTAGLEGALVRITLVAANGCRAWTNPFVID